MTPRRFVLATLALVTTFPALPLLGQAAPPEAHAMVNRERAPLIVAAVRLPLGSRDDPAGLDGAAWLLSHTLAEQANVALALLGAEVEAQPARESTTFVLSALPASWGDAWRVFRAVLADAPLEAERFEGVRTRTLGQLGFRAASPANEFESEATRMLAPPGDPWARSRTGFRASLEAVGLADLEALRRASLRADDAVVAVIGPASDPTAIVADAPVRASRPEGPAWTTGDRVQLTREVTSAWLAIAYPLGGQVSATTMEFLAHLLHDGLDPVPADPDRYGVDVEIVHAPGGPVLLVEAAVVPEAAGRWERKILDAVAALEADPPAGEFFRWARRRFRADRLLADAAMKPAAVRIAEDLATTGGYRDLEERIWALTEAEVARAVAALGEPRVLLLGPDLSGARR